MKEESIICVQKDVKPLLTKIHKNISNPLYQGYSLLLYMSIGDLISI